ncbi:response regulator transcription factor [Agromyces silvae]|uniref:response regulator transcription factor n=1 Tax=Agromyces silvae TaxID=3388266 RepID=UPI00280B4854|nr:response regulator transcription factor [Agromyces protaetiae]
MTAGADPSVLVVDDHALVRSGIVGLLQAADCRVVGEAGDGHAAIDAAVALRPDVVLMDIRMPGLDGIAATEALVSRPDPPKVLILTTFDLDEYVYRALRAGASGFLLKDAPPERLIDAVRIVAQGETLLAPALTRRLIERYIQAPPPNAADPGPADLTPREREVWLCLAKGRSNLEIAQQLFLSEATVKAHVTRLLAKLGLRDRVQAVVAAYESGLIRPGEPT